MIIIPVLIVVAVLVWALSIFTAWRKKKNLLFAKQLVSLLTQAQQLESCLNRNLPIQEHNYWVESVENYLLKNLGSSYALRFTQFRGMTFNDSDSEQTRISNSINGRMFRLIDFIVELIPENPRIGLRYYLKSQVTVSPLKFEASQ